MKLYTLDNQFIKETYDSPSDFTGIIIYNDGTKWWYLNGKRHRIDGPAREWLDGTKHWYVEGKLHRVDGPALEFPNGTKSWWVDDKRITEEQHNLLHSIMELKGLI